jgi:hypothetical protein
MQILKADRRVLVSSAQLQSLSTWISTVQPAPPDHVAEVLAEVEGHAAGASTRTVRAQLEQLQDTYRVTLDYTVDRRGQVELKPERV